MIDKARNPGRETRLLRLMELCRRTRSPVSPEMMSLVWKLRLDLEKQEALEFQPRFSRNLLSGIRFSKWLCCFMDSRLGGTWALPARLGLQSPE